MISSIKQYKKGEVSSVQDRLVPNEIYKTQSYGKESLDLIFDYQLNNDYDFKLLISSYSKIELLDQKNVYKKELIKFWEHQFNLKFSSFWNIYYNISKAKIKKAAAANQSPIDNWKKRLGVERKSTDPIDFRISLLEKSGVANTNVERRDIVSSNDDIVENSTLNAMRSPFLTNSAEERQTKSVDVDGNINMSERSTEISQAPDPHLLSFLYGDNVELKQKKKSIVNSKKIEDSQSLADAESKKRKDIKREQELAKEADEIFDRLAEVNLDEFYTHTKQSTYTHDFFTQEFNNSLNGPDEDDKIDEDFFDKFDFLGASSKQNIIARENKNSAKYQNAYELFKREEIIKTPQTTENNKIPVISKTKTKPKLNAIDAKKEVLKELRQEAEYKRQLHKLNIKNNKILKKRREDKIREDQKEQKDRIELSKKSIREYDKITSIENEIKLDKLIGKKSGVIGKNKAKLRQEQEFKKKITVDEQKEMYEIDAQLIEAQNEIANIDKNINQK